MTLVDKSQWTAHWFFEVVAMRIFARAAAVVTGMIQMAAQLAGGRELMALRAHMRGLRPCTSGYASSCCRGQRETARGTLANTARPPRSAVEACPRRDQLDADASRYECAPRSLKRRGRVRLLRSRATNAQTGGCQPLACCGRQTRRQRFIYDFQPTHWGSPDARSLERSPSIHQK